MLVPLVSLGQLIFFSFIFFYIFLCLYAIITTPSPINAVLYLIGLFLGISSLLIYCGADYLGVLFLLVYGGAISILILFVVMLLDLKDITFVPRHQLPAARAMLVILFSVFYGIFLNNYLPLYGYSVNYYVDWFRILSLKSNIEAVGIAFYTYYNFQFILIGFLLFVSMVVIISMVVNVNYVSKKQVVHLQLLQSQDLYFIDSNAHDKKV